MDHAVWCKHGMIREWCGICMMPKHPRKRPAESSGRGVGNYIPDRRHKIWRKPILDKELRSVVK